MLARELISIHESPREVTPFSSRYAGLTPQAGYEAARALHDHRVLLDVGVLRARGQLVRAAVRSVEVALGPDGAEPHHLAALRRF